MCEVTNFAQPDFTKKFSSIKNSRDIKAVWVSNIRIENTEYNNAWLKKNWDVSSEDSVYFLYAVKSVAISPVNINTTACKLPKAYPKIKKWYLKDSATLLKKIYKNGIMTYENCKR